MSARSVLLVGVVVLAGSSVPFVPTGEVVSAAAALAGSLPVLAVVLAVVVLASVAGDSVLLMGVRRLGRHVVGHPSRRADARSDPCTDPRATWRGRVAASLRSGLDGWAGAVRANALSAVVTGRLVPGGRAPVIITLALEHYPLRRFVAADLVACTAWSSVYVVLGAAGGSASGHPVLGLAAAVVGAVALGAVLRLLTARRAARRAARRPGRGPGRPAGVTAPGGDRLPVP